jgi:hypothetical protein
MILFFMDLGIKFGGKIATAADVEFINNMLLSNPETNRRQLSIKLCKAWNWVQPNGFLRDMVCRGFLLKLERAGYIKLPAQRTPSYNHPIYYLETFVDKERFKGTCYYAANWKYLGDTTGRGKNAPTRKVTRSIKAVLGYPLTKRFREYLCR